MTDEISSSDSPEDRALRVNEDAAELPDEPPDNVLTRCPGTRPPYVQPETRILMSFAMRNDGHLFSQWLRNKLMISLDYFSPMSVYLDTVASREKKLVFKNKMPWFQWPGVTYVVPNWESEKYDGYTTIGALNRSWNKNYRAAMSQASVMIFLLTPDYTKSKWCMLEWEQYQQENARRARKGLPPLRGLVVGFESDEETRKFAGGKADTLTVPRVDTAGGHPTALHAVKEEGAAGAVPAKEKKGVGKAISEESYQQILGWVRVQPGV